ncbi:jg9590 [Pararge aegeria aegeria]|uniref:Jg9590 protein n=1 Tax=Pararge aegeria aegeria TaxID=348720 RepID=A0A8S4S8E4_9NEOP|nr:jg9590 [Pararge aegeria aegeria]
MVDIPLIGFYATSHRNTKSLSGTSLSVRRELRNKEALSRAVRAARERASREHAPPADEFADMLDVPNILRNSIAIPFLLK